MFLIPSEEKMIELLEAKKIPISQIKVNPDKLIYNVSKQLQNFCFRDPEIKYCGQKAFISYVRSVFLQKNKQVFKVDELPLEEFASALGLPGQPKVKFLNKRTKDSVKHYNVADEEEKKEKDKEKSKTKIERMFARKNMNVLSEHYQKLMPTSEEGSESEGEDDFMKIKRKDHDLEDLPKSAPTVVTSKKKLQKLKEKEIKSRGLGQKFVFTEEGDAVPAYKLEELNEYTSKLADERGIEGEGEQVLIKAGEMIATEKKEEMKAIDLQDKKAHKEKIKEKKLSKKRKEKERRREGSKGGGAVLAGDYEEDNSDRYEEESEDDTRERKRVKGNDVEDLEALAMQLLDD
jgi:ATP-dependent RNA helicase DDX10/DBP4